MVGGRLHLMKPLLADFHIFPAKSPESSRKYPATFQFARHLDFSAENISGFLHQLGPGLDFIWKCVTKHSFRQLVEATNPPNDVLLQSQMKAAAAGWFNGFHL